MVSKEAETFEGDEGKIPKQPITEGEPKEPKVTPERYKALQRQVSEKDRKVQELERELQLLKAREPSQEILSMIAELKERLEEHGDVLDELREGQTLGEEKPKLRLEQRKAKELARTLAAEHGFNPYDKELMPCYNEPDPVRAVNRKIAEIRKAQQVQSSKKLAEEIEQAKAKGYEDALRQHSDALKGEGGSPSSLGQGWTLAKIEKLQQTPEGLKEFLKHKDEILEAMNRGEIK